jgi:hypothetical protein
MLSPTVLRDPCDPFCCRWIPFLLRSGQAEVLVAVSTAALPVATIARLCAALIGDRTLVRPHTRAHDTAHGSRECPHWEAAMRVRASTWVELLTACWFTCLFGVLRMHVRVR